LHTSLLSRDIENGAVSMEIEAALASMYGGGFVPTANVNKLSKFNAL
jgi:hypothetical protein